MNNHGSLEFTTFINAEGVGQNINVLGDITTRFVEASTKSLDEALRARLVELGWTPPAEAQAQGGGEVNPWQFAIDQARVVAHLGVAADGVSKEEAVKQLGELIHFHIAIATDPAVNGGFRLTPVAAPPSAPPSAPVASEHVRRLVGHLAQWVLCMSHNESYFGEAAGHLKSTVEELARSVDPIYPPKPSPSDSLAGVEIHTATVPFMPAQLPTTTAPPSAPVGELVSALQSMRDRMMAALPPKFGDAFDGDFDTLREAINALKGGRRQNLAAQPGGDR